MSVDFDPASELGLMGGMFDPVHLGHLNVATSVLELLQLDSLRLMPCGNPVHRRGLIGSSEHRLAMLEIAIAGNRQLEIDDRECRSDNPSYTFTSLLATRQENPGSRLYCIMGQDAFKSLPTWYRWQEIFELVHVVVAGRPKVDPGLDTELRHELERRQVTDAQALKNSKSGKILMAQIELLDISSSLVREKIMAGESVENLLPEGVAGYIQTHGLYSGEVSS